VQLPAELTKQRCYDSKQAPGLPIITRNHSVPYLWRPEAIASCTHCPESGQPYRNRQQMCPKVNSKHTFAQMKDNYVAEGPQTSRTDREY
jgi:hypothetical protein